MSFRPASVPSQWVDRRQRHQHEVHQRRVWRGQLTYSPRRTLATIHGLMRMLRNESVARSRWARWGVGVALVGMLSWVVGVALIPLDAKLENGEQALAATLASVATQQYVAALLAVVGGVLLVAFFGVLTRLVPEGEPGWGLLRIALAGCVVTQTMVAIGSSFGLIGIHSAVAGASPTLVAFAWRGVWLTFLASAIPTILFTITGILGLAAAGLIARWVAVIGWISAAAHVLVVFTVAQSGIFAPDGIVGALTPVTTVVWIIAVAVQLPGRLAALQPREDQS